MDTPRLLDDSNVERVAAILAEAMDGDPAYRYLMPDSSSRPRGLRDYFARSLRTYLPHRCTYLAVEAGVVDGTVTVRPPGGIDVSTLTMIRRGLLPFAFAHGTAAVRRLFALKDAYDGIETRLSGGAPHWYVHMMAVDPARQGRGRGTALLSSVLASIADARGRSSHPVLLTTHNEQNVTFYRRAGFEIVDVEELSLAGACAYPVWGMRRT